MVLCDSVEIFHHRAGEVTIIITKNDGSRQTFTALATASGSIVLMDETGTEL